MLSSLDVVISFLSYLFFLKTEPEMTTCSAFQIRLCRDDNGIKWSDYYKCNRSQFFFISSKNKVQNHVSIGINSVFV